MTSSKMLLRCASTVWMLALTAAILVACGGKSTPSATPTPGPTETKAACSADECAAVAEPPISPAACGEGHEKDISTVCQRGASGACEKVLQCTGAATTP